MKKANMDNVDRSLSVPVSASAASASRAPVISVAPLVPVVVAMAAGIVADRYGASFETSDWITLALMAITVSALCLGRHAISCGAICVTVMALGGAWHHHQWNGYALDDLGWSVTE